MAGEEDVSTLFIQFGPINQIRIVKSPNGRSTGTAFVTFETSESSKKALSLNGTVVDGRTIIVSIADPNLRARKKLEKYQDRDKSLFLPRATLKSKPKAKIGVISSQSSSMQVDSKSQDDFRRMLGIQP
jgi:RNA recognition motif-containing protein